MDQVSKSPLANLSPSLRVLIIFFVIAMFIGYGVALMKIYAISSFKMTEAVVHYRGDETAGAGIFLPQSYGAMLSIAHVHTLSQPLMFALVGLLFCLSSWKERTKAWIVSFSFIGILLGNLTPWLVRYGAAGCVFIFILAQLLMGD